MVFKLVLESPTLMLQASFQQRFGVIFEDLGTLGHNFVGCYPIVKVRKKK